MTENRTPIQISGNLVLCEDKTLWELGRYGWVKLDPIPTDEEYDIMLQDRFKQQTEYLERICKTLKR